MLFPRMRESRGEPGGLDCRVSATITLGMEIKLLIQQRRDVRHYEAAPPRSDRRGLGETASVLRRDSRPFPGPDDSPFPRKPCPGEGRGKGVRGLGPSTSPDTKEAIASRRTVRFMRLRGSICAGNPPGSAGALRCPHRSVSGLLVFLALTTLERCDRHKLVSASCVAS